jgi:hypothetical protein
MAQMSAAVRDHEHSMRHAPGSSSPTKHRRRSPRGEERGDRRSLEPLPAAAPRARRQPPRRRTRLDAQQSRDEHEEQKWKLHSGHDPMMSTQEILRLDALDDAEERLIQSVMDLQAGEETFCTWLLNRPLIETLLSVGNLLVLQKGLDELVEAVVFEVEQKTGGQLQVGDRSLLLSSSRARFPPQPHLFYLAKPARRVQRSRFLSRTMLLRFALCALFRWPRMSGCSLLARKPPSRAANLI